MNIVKKLIGLVAACFVVVAVVGCGGSSTAKSTKVGTTTPAGSTGAAETKMEEKK